MSGKLKTMESLKTFTFACGPWHSTATLIAIKCNKREKEVIALGGGCNEKQTHARNFALRVKSLLNGIYLHKNFPNSRFKYPQTYDYYGHFTPDILRFLSFFFLLVFFFIIFYSYFLKVLKSLLWKLILCWDGSVSHKINFRWDKGSVEDGQK